MDDFVKRAIKENADSIREKIKCSRLFGDSIDMDDVDSLILAAYHLGQREIREEADRERNFLYSLYRQKV